MTDPALTLRSALGEFAGFMRRPRVLAAAGLRAPGNFRRWLWLTLLLVAGLIGVVLPLLHVWQKAFGLPDPEAFEAFPREWLVPTVVVFAPLIEELLFRGWQSGSRAALWLLACALIGIGAIVLSQLPQGTMPALLLLLAALGTGLTGWLVLRKKPGPLDWFARFYPAIFYAAAALFALVHLGNYGMVSLIAVPLVLPQLWAGLVLGYLRQQVGLIGAIVAHAMSNLCVVALALASG